MSYSIKARLPVLHLWVSLTALSKESNVSISFKYDIHVGHREMETAGQKYKDNTSKYSCNVNKKGAYEINECRFCRGENGEADCRHQSIRVVSLWGSGGEDKDRACLQH